MEEIEEVWSRLRLSEEENTPIVAIEGQKDSDRRRGERSLVGKICTTRRIGKQTVKGLMEKIWKVSLPLDFEEISLNCFVITFASSRDKTRVLEGCPWLFENYLFVLRDYDGEIQPNSMNFDYEKLWIQMHNLPLGYMNKRMGEEIGSSVGKVIEVDVDEEGWAWGRCLRVRIECNLKAPLARGRTVKVAGGQIWVPFQYEKLPRMCFQCGCIVHSREGCSVGEVSGKNQFGTWLRASVSIKKQSQQKESKKKENVSGDGEGMMDIRDSKGEVRSEGVEFEEIPVKVHKGDEKSGGRVDTELKGHEPDVQEGLNSAVISIEQSAVIPEVNLEVEKIDEEEVQDKGTQVEKKKCWKRRVRGRGQVSQVCSLNLNSKRAIPEEDVEMLLLGGGKKARLNEGAEPVYNLCEVEAVEQPHLAL
ncbi:uncharacterized protein LOC122299602 [Carya illinoinensis]|uniref:uncharacterized protein LOC122299602 n=1 Tax=Carya illinoinensis TaxID=32201 RepID=UPI001C723CBA|nr:uncharacterized protein LOC122299602 [Carya illinoinensis]